MPAVLMTEMGDGPMWRFPTEGIAKKSMLFQPGDVICRDWYDLIERWHKSYMPMLLGRTGDPVVIKEQMEKAVRLSKAQGRDARNEIAELAKLVWPVFLGNAKEPPSDKAELEALAADARASMKRREKMADDTEEKAVKVKKTKAVKEPRNEEDKKPHNRLPEDGVIELLADKEGKEYSAENPPIKSKAAEHRFSIYKDGMTVQQAFEAGLSRSEVRRDRRKGFIKIAA